MTDKIYQVCLYGKNGKRYQYEVTAGFDIKAIAMAEQAFAKEYPDVELKDKVSFMPIGRVAI